VAKSRKNNKKRKDEMRTEDMAAMGVRGFKKQRAKKTRRRETDRYASIY